MKLRTLKVNLIKPLLFFIIILISTAEIRAEVIYATPLQGTDFQIGTMLEWVTSKEMKSQLFVVEKSMDGFTFEGIGEVSAAGKSNDHKGYRFLDANPGDKVAYYRLRQIDTDGTSSYSEILELEKETPNYFTITAMTNTTTSNWLEIGLESAVSGIITYKVKNADDEVVIDNSQQLNTGLNSIAFNLTDEPEGTYFLVLTLDDEQEEIVIRKINDDLIKKPNVASKKEDGSGNY